MNLFENMLGGDESLFLESMALDVDYTPPVIKHREGEQGHIASCLKPLFSKRSGKNLIITGVPGIGKTLATKHILEELKDQTNDIKTIFINCWKKDTPYKIIAEMCQQLGFKFIAGRNTDELTKEVIKILNKSSCVIVLDEADKIEDQHIFYSILEEIFTKCLICITNDGDWLNKLDQRVRSRMLAELVQFKSYNYEEIKSILQERVNYAFVPCVFESEAFDLIVDKCSEIGDVRSGLFLLKNAGEEAEAKSKRKITIEEAKIAIEKLVEFQRKSTSQLGEEEELILNLVKNNSGKTSSKMHEIYSINGGKLAYTTFQRKLKSLEKGKFVTLNKVNVGKGMTTTVNYGGPDNEKTLGDYI